LLNPEDLVLAEAERDVRELEQYLADQYNRVFDLHAAGRDDDEMKAREGLLLLADALVIARRRLRAEREAAAMSRPDTGAVSWEFGENLHRAELTVTERDSQIAERAKLSINETRSD